MSDCKKCTILTEIMLSDQRIKTKYAAALTDLRQQIDYAKLDIQDLEQDRAKIEEALYRFIYESS